MSGADFIDAFRTETRRFRPLELRAKLGHADEALLFELDQTVDRFDALARRSTPNLAGMVQNYVVEAIEAKAHALTFLGRRDEAELAWQQALGRWQAAGATTRVDACRTALRGIRQAERPASWDEQLVAGHRRVEHTPPDSIARASALYDLAAQYGDAGETFDAFRYAKQALEVLDRATGHHEGAASGDDLLATLSDLVGLGLAGETTTGAADAAKDSWQTHNLYADALILMANSLVDDDPERAQAYIQKARLVRQDKLDRESYLAHCRERYGALLGGMAPPSMPVRLALELVDLSAERRRPGSTMPRDRMVQELQELASFAHRIGEHRIRHRALVEAASIRREQGQLLDAVELLEVARDAHDQLSGAEPPVPLLREWAEVETRRGNWTRTLELCTEGVQIVESERRGKSAAFVRSSVLRRGVRLYELGALAARQLDDTSEAVQFCELSKARGVARPARAGGDHVAALRRRFDETTDALQWAQAGSGPSADIVMQRQLLWDVLVAARGEGLPEVRSLEAVRRALPDGCVAVSYYWVDPTLLAITVVDPQSATMVTVPVTGKRQMALAAAVAAASTEAPGRDLEPSLEPLPEILFPEPVGERLAGASRIFFAPHRRLHSLPLHAVPLRGEPLLARAAVAYVPNLSTLCRPWHTRVPGAVLFGVDDDGRHPRLEDVEHFLKEDIARQYRQAGYTVEAALGPDCTAGRLRRVSDQGLLRDARVAYLIAHGTNLPFEHPFEARLFLRDRAVDGLELSQLDMGAEVVVVAACHSGRRAVQRRMQQGRDAVIDELPGDDQLGLSAALFASGAQSVLGSLWRLRVESLRPVLSRFTHVLVRGAPPDVALQQAVVGWDISQRAMSMWAPLLLTVGAGPFSSGFGNASARPHSAGGHHDAGPT